MNKELIAQLGANYPKMFLFQSLDQPANRLQISSDDGWYNILDAMFSCINAYIEDNNSNEKFPISMDYPAIRQIKEKFGTLRVYLIGTDSNINAIIHFAERMSTTTCEKCGNIGKRRPGGWAKVLCDKHHKERQQEIYDRD